MWYFFHVELRSGASHNDMIGKKIDRKAVGRYINHTKGSLVIISDICIYEVYITYITLFIVKNSIIYIDKLEY